MLLLLILLVALSEARKRVILQVKDAKNATYIGADAVKDPGWHTSIAANLLCESDIASFNAGFRVWANSTWDIDLSKATYDPVTTGYNFTNGQAYPTTIIDPQHIIIYDSVNPSYAYKRSVSVSAWFVQFNASYVQTGGVNAGAYIDPYSALMYMKFFFLKIGADWSKPQNKEVMPCQTDVTAKYFTNQYILGGAWGGINDVISYTCFDHTSHPISYCDKQEINVWYRIPTAGPLEYVNETARVTYICH